MLGSYKVQILVYPYFIYRIKLELYSFARLS